MNIISYDKIINIYYNKMEFLVHYLKIRFSYLLELCKYLNHDLFNNIQLDHDNIHNYNELFLEYEIIKTNNKIVCINREFEIKDLNEFSLNQIAMMRVKYNSFSIELRDKNSDITQEYVDNLKNEVIKIFNEIRDYHKPSLFNLTKTKISYTNKPKYDDNINITSNYYNYIEILEDTFGLVNRMIPLSDVYIYLYNMFDDIILNDFKKKIYKNMDKERLDLINRVYYLLNDKQLDNKDIEIINKYLIYFKTLKFKYMKTYTKQELDSFM